VFDESSRRVSRARFRCFRNSPVGFDITPQGIKRTADISRDEAVDMVRQLEAQARQEFVRGYLFALIYAGLGDKTKAIDYLKREYLDHDNINPTRIRVDAMLDTLQAIRGSRQSRRGSSKSQLGRD
jgi:hypothetical protein